MSAPGVTFTVTKTAISGVEGQNSASISFVADAVMTAYEIRATMAGENYGRGVGTNVQSSSQTIPAGTEVTAAIYNTDLTLGDGDYRISIFAQGQDGSWNDNCAFIPSGSSGLVTADGKRFLCMR